VKRTTKVGRKKARQLAKFNAACVHAAEAVIRKMKADGTLPKSINMLGTLYTNCGSLEVSNLNHQLVWNGYEIGDDVKVSVEFVKRNGFQESIPTDN